MHLRAILAGLAALTLLSANGPGDPPACAPTKCTQQSPVDIVGAIRADIAKPVVHYEAGHFEIENDGHTLKVTPLGGHNTVDFAGVVYSLAQFHFHHKAEHLVNGVQAAMEVHFVNLGPLDTKLVLGVLLQPGGTNSLFTEIMAAAPPPGHKVIVSLDPNHLLPIHHSLWTYKGSLTTPPFSEDVTWVVFQNDELVAGHDIDKYALLFEHQAPHPPQNLHRRFILSVP